MNNNISRRKFLLQAGALGLAASSRAWAGPFSILPSARKRHTLVAIYLRGGCDPLNQIVPFKDKTYYKVRPTIALAESDGIIPVTSKWALAPSMAALEPAFREKDFAVIMNAGSPHRTRSHFDAQDFMEFGAPGDRTVRDGWLNRYLRLTQTKESDTLRAFSMQELLPRSLRGEYPVLAVPTSMEKKKGTSTLDKFDSLFGEGAVSEGGGGLMGLRQDDGTGVVLSGQVTIETLRRFQEILSKTKPNQAAGYAQSTFGNRLQAIAQVVRSGAPVEVVGLDYNGWDDHNAMGGVEGRHHVRTQDLATSLAAFRNDLGEQMNEVTVVVMTEFGRTVRENGNSGTDHGHGGAMWVLGGGVKGGKVHGKFTGLDDSQLYQGRDLPVTTDFRDVMGEILKHS
ncbi:MAG: DUF1501 domain-containing protein, partial [Planctomycetes bacterium]|nr:DUF1501 domain-containing protein [Planctomycetota bacterium]